MKLKLLIIIFMFCILGVFGEVSVNSIRADFEVFFGKDNVSYVGDQEFSFFRLFSSEHTELIVTNITKEIKGKNETLINQSVELNTTWSGNITYIFVNEGDGSFHVYPLTKNVVDVKVYNETLTADVLAVGLEIFINFIDVVSSSWSFCYL